MKLFHYLFLIVVLGLSSCKKDADPSPVTDFTSTLTAKTWVDDGSIAIVNGKTYVGKNATIDGTTVNSGPDPNTTFIFKKDGKFEITDESGTDSGTWKLSGTTLTLSSSYEDDRTFTLSAMSSSGFIMSAPVITPKSPEDEYDAAYFGAGLILASNGADLPTSINTIQLQKKLKAK